MGNNIFGANISGKLAKAFKGRLLTGFLLSSKPGTRTALALAGGENDTTRRAPFDGFLSSYKESEINGTTVKKGDRKLSIMGDSLPVGRVPESNDKAEIEGSTFRIMGIESRDPDAALYVLQARPVKS